ncbi:hypothetical protein [Thaumasiovibrio subtropicus]|uniref:hypothetical protein n=1 Tax=Thaumasiovibrio subtropicus TaxID=1891207 RepID=UPI000B34F83D|nr:hypothetical protein [Thaumasiovibrio subtropicus]
MPFTPFHMGAGVVMKSAAGRHFSLTLFGWSQIVIDVQPLVVLLSGGGHLHGWSHTLLGAIGLAIVAAVTGKPLCHLGFLIIRRRHYLPITWTCAFVTAFLGTISHVLFDALIHSDMYLFAPFSTSQPLLGLLSWDDVNRMCIGLGILGVALYVYRFGFGGNKQ